MSLFLQLLVSGVMVGGIYALVALGFVLIYKATRVLNFAVGEFVLFGALICWALVSFHIPMWVGILLGIAGGATLGFMVERFTMRPLIGQPILSAIAMTLGLMVLLQGIIGIAWGGPPRAYPEFLPSGTIELGGIMLFKTLIWEFAIALVVLAILIVFIQRARAGLTMRATAEDHQVAQAAGIKVRQVFSMVWVLSAAVCVVGGVLLGNICGVTLLLREYGLKVIPAVILGGVESIPGAVVGGLLIGILERLAMGYLNPLVGGATETVFVYTIMMLVLVIRPYGLFGLKTIERL